MFEAGKVIVVGAGLAGCSCAIALAGRGINVTLVEAGATLGGRVQSVSLRGIDREIDNCQHAAFRVYNRFLQLIGHCDAREILRIQSQTRLSYLEVDKGRISTLKSGKLPPPNHLAMSLLRAPFLSLKDKIAMQKAVKALQKMTEKERRNLDDIDFLTWLKENGQTERAIKRFWDPLVMAALNIDSANASSSSAAFLFRKGLFSNTDSFDVESFTGDLSGVLDPALRRTLSSVGVKLRTSSPVMEILSKDGMISGVSTRDEKIPADTVILCTPIKPTTRLLRGGNSSEINNSIADNLESIGNTTLMGLHAFHEGPVLPENTQFVTCIEEPLIQMLFDRTGELDEIQRAGLPGHWISVPVSFADPYLSMKDTEIRTEYERVVKTAFPNSPELIQFHVVRAKRATSALRPGTQRFRPNADDASSGIILGGDWLDTDWPSTMEGAVRGGLSAAAHLLAVSGDEQMNDWHHDMNWPDWPEPPRRGSKGWTEW